jgi:hypothetical protein
MTRIAQTKYVETVTFRLTNGSTAATITEKVGWFVPVGKSFRVDRVIYNNPTGLVADASNFFVIAVKGVTSGLVAAQWSTATGVAGQGTLSADIPVTLVNTTNNVLAGGEFPQATYTKTGTQTLPPGSLTIEGRLI